MGFQFWCQSQTFPHENWSEFLQYNECRSTPKFTFVFQNFIIGRWIYMPQKYYWVWRAHCGIHALINWVKLGSVEGLATVRHQAIMCTNQSGRSPKVVTLFSAANFSSYIIELLQLHDTIQFKWNYACVHYNIAIRSHLMIQKLDEI